MIPAAGVESGCALRTLRPAIHVFANRQFMTARPAKNRANVPLGAEPYLDSVIGEDFVAILAGVVDAAAAHSDRKDVER
ncbi:hypothetical protein HNQ77_005423 [Silvibacterium bohemicum]|uniref:Uncharacterized protein n=1 Tax=Silvibacterium bohemicum TaxID=1577686 RepID=A0A841K4D4_9BACT|nr:hypothetical protein [Silvibacterium bohemicum]